MKKTGIITLAIFCVLASPAVSFAAEQPDWLRQAPRTADGQVLPFGSYIESCRDLRIIGDRLHASCPRNNGKWVQSSIRIKPGMTVENRNGKLSTRKRLFG